MKNNKKTFNLENFNFDGWWIYEPENKNEFFLAPHLKDMMGLANQTVPYQLHWFLEKIHPDDQPIFLKAIESNSKEKHTIEYRILLKENQYLWVMCRIHREEHRISGIQTDITKQKELQLQLLRSNKELEQFAYVTSHDLQSPIRHIWTFSDLAKKYVKDQKIKEAEESIDKVIKTCAHIKNLVQDLLTYSRLGRDELHFSVVNPEDSINIALDILSEEINMKSAKISIENIPKSINANPEYFIDIFVNLISNSLKYSKKDIIPKIKIDCVKRMGKYHFSVQDNGIGIAAQEREIIFNIFKRSPSKKNNLIKGSGIGLSTVKKIVEMHGGEIRVDSELGKGSTFTFTLL